MSLTWKLLTAHVRQQKVRFALTALAMIAAVGVVLWVVSAYETIASRFDDQTAEFVGNYTAFVVPKELDDGLSEELIAAIKSNADVAAANPVTQFRMSFRRVGEPPEGTAPRGRGLGRLGPTIVGTTATEPRYELIEGRWLSENAENEAVVSSGIADALVLKPGDSIEFRTKAEKPLRLQVVGITEEVEGVEFAMTRTRGGAPGGFNRGPASLAAYVPLRVIEQLTGAAPKINLLEIRLQGEAAIDGVAREVDANPAAELLRPEDVRAKLAGGFEASEARKQAYFVTALSIIASAFIIFTTLSMGVNERARQLAILRAVGVRRSQISQLVLIEGLCLAVFGWLGGLAGGWGLLQGLAVANPALFPNGVSFGAVSILLAGLCSLLGALLASIFPIWKATRVSPLEAMAPLQTAPRRSRWYWGAGVVSLVLIALTPVMALLPDLDETLRFVLILLIGVPATVAGFVLLAPLVVVAVEAVFSPLVATLLRLQRNLVRTQLSDNLWRSAAIAAALMLGLGLYTATQVWGFSMLSGFLPGRWTPNTIVKFERGLNEAQVAQVLATPGIEEGACFPIAVEQTKLVGDPLKSGERDSAVRQDNVALIGIDAEQAFTGEVPAFELDFVEGDRDTAIAKLQSGRHCIVPDTFVTYADLHVGDRIGLMPPKSPQQAVEYTIVGVVAMPGSNWMTKTSGIRRNAVRTAGLVFAPRAQVSEDFDLQAVEYFWLDTESGVSASDLKQRLQLIADGGASTAAMEAPRRERKGPPGERRGRGPGGDSLQVTSIDEVRSGLQSRAGAAVQAMGWLPLVTLVIVSLGVVNTVAASVRARRWEFGILRAVGLTRSRLSRLVISEALLVGLVASVLSLTFGILTGWTCLNLVRYVSNPWFEGVRTQLVVPWPQLALGYGLAFILCLLAALWPAISSGRSEPLALLQGGRSSI